MYASKVKRDMAPEDLEENEASRTEGEGRAKNQRRLSDSVKPKGRKLNLDRRVEAIERRTGGTSEYKGPARRKVIDRRESTTDRRDED
jgi:hypothetical protein